MDNTYWGYHLILNCASANIDKITDYDNVVLFAKQLVKRIDMVAFGEPQVVNFGSGNKAGFTLVQLIETSNICAHFCNDTGDIYLDVFSCKPYDPAVVVETVTEFFNPQRCEQHFLHRQA